MKTIVISGAHSNVGKTTLSQEICSLIPGAIAVKIGHCSPKESKIATFYQQGTSFESIAREHSRVPFLIIESNQILKEFTPDCTIYLTGKTPKPSAVDAREKADIIRGTRVDLETISLLSRRLTLSTTDIHKLIWLSGARPVPASAIILAGGKSTRMGIDKALLNINGKSAVTHIYNQLVTYFDEIILSMNTEKEVHLRNIRVVSDIEDGHGPLMGVYSALMASQSMVNFVIACDIPKINMALLFKQLAFSEEYAIVVPSFKEGQFEPLFAIYNKNVTSAAKKMLDQKNRRIYDLFSECKTKIVTTPDNMWYVNLNTPDDYQNFLVSLQKVAG